MATSCVGQVREILANAAGLDAAGVENELEALLGRIEESRATMGALRRPVEEFIAVTRRYWPGLFHCYRVEGLPKTNNDLEQFFGALRHQERRVTGRKKPTATLVVRGRVRVVASLETLPVPMTAEQLRPRDVAAWRQLRCDLEAAHEVRRRRLRFRRDSESFLADLEDKASKLFLLS